jgi:hypothetical protein
MDSGNKAERITAKVFEESERQSDSKSQNRHQQLIKKASTER